MKFISKHGAHKITVNSGTSSPVVYKGGATEFRSNNDDFTAVFEVKTLTAREIESAKEQIFSNAKHGQAFGSPPRAEGGLIDVAEAVEGGFGSMHYDGYDVYQSLSTFDTANPLQCPPEWREETEQFLLNCPEYGYAIVRVDNWNLQPPWPTYPEGPNPNIANVVKFAQAGGLLNEALAFEEAEYNRPELIQALKAALAAEVAASEEDAGLSAKV